MSKDESPWSVDPDGDVKIYVGRFETSIWLTKADLREMLCSIESLELPACGHKNTRTVTDSHAHPDGRAFQRTICDDCGECIRAVYVGEAI